MNTEKELYLVARASDYGDSPPCDGAYKTSVFYMVSVPASFADGDTNWYSAWLSNGTNHRQVGDKLFKEGCTDEWVVEVGSIQDFVKQYGRCIVSWDEDCSMFKIVIYDDYVE